MIKINSIKNNIHIMQSISLYIFISIFLLSSSCFANDKDAQTFSTSPSFSCNGQLSNIEKLICSDSQLASADRALSIAYKSALAIADDPAQLRVKQRDWLENQRNLCETNQCLLEAINARISELTHSGEGQAVIENRATPVENKAELALLEQRSIEKSESKGDSLDKSSQSQSRIQEVEVKNSITTSEKSNESPPSGTALIISSLIVISLLASYYCHKKIVYFRSKIDYGASLAIAVIVIIFAKPDHLETIWLPAFFILQLILGFRANNNNVLHGFISALSRTFTGTLLGIIGVIGGSQSREQAMRSIAQNVSANRKMGRNRDAVMLEARAAISEYDKRANFYQEYIYSRVVINIDRIGTQ